MKNELLVKNYEKEISDFKVNWYLSRVVFLAKGDHYQKWGFFLHVCCKFLWFSHSVKAHGPASDTAMIGRNCVQCEDHLIIIFPSVLHDWNIVYLAWKPVSPKGFAYYTLQQILPVQSHFRAPPIRVGGIGGQPGNALARQLVIANIVLSGPI